MNRFNLKAFKRFWAIARPYWFGNEKKGALTLLLFLFFLLLVNAPLSVLLTRLQGNLISDLTRLDRDAFVQTIRVFIGVLIIYVPLSSGFGYIQNKLGNYWRRWLTYDFIKRYFSHRAFYELGNINTEIDNPDQRISEDIKSFTVDSLSFLLIIVNSIFQMIGFAGLLWIIPPRVVIFTLPQPISFSINLWQLNYQVNIERIEPSVLVIFLLVYAVIGTIITVGVFGRKLVTINYEQLTKEANFRFSLVRIRENSESIAFYQGERQESRNLRSIFTTVFQNYNLLILWQELLLPLFTNAYENVPYILPAIVVAPSVFAGDIEVGKVREAQIAFAQFFFAVNLIVARFQFLTAFVAGIDRLYLLREYLDKSELVSPEVDTIETIIDGNRIAIKGLTLQTPNYQQTLIKNLSVTVEPHTGLLVMGASGCGKSSLLRAIAGLWDSGKGSIVRPDLDEMLFLPQKPYMILGTLRNQLTYPHDSTDITDSELEKVLAKVNLPDLAERFGGFEREEDWADVLSLGEQQRLAFARILINKPRYIILDEATSALDINNEAGLYRHLKQVEATFISVGHRPTLAQYHHRILRLLDKDRWTIEDSPTMGNL